jgi:hypothetical protein
VLTAAVYNGPMANGSTLISLLQVRYEYGVLRVVARPRRLTGTHGNDRDRFQR